MVPTCGLDLCPSAHGGGEAEAGALWHLLGCKLLIGSKEGEQGAQKERRGRWPPQRGHTAPLQTGGFAATQGTLGTLWEPPVRLWTPERMVATHSYLLPAHSKSTPDTPSHCHSWSPEGLISSHSPLFLVGHIWHIWSFLNCVDEGNKRQGFLCVWEIERYLF